MANLLIDRVRQKLIEEGDKNLEKKRSEIETYKLKVVELRLWKKKWQSRLRNNEMKKRKRKSKMDARRAWIKEQIEKGYMHKSCTILVHSRAKFPFEPGFEPLKSKKSGKKSGQSAENPDNLCPFIKGVHVGKNGLVYPYKKRVENGPKMAKNRPNKPKLDEDEPLNVVQETPIITTEPIFTIINNPTVVQNPENPEFILQNPNPGPNQEIHYIQEPIMENILVDESGNAAVIHYIQFDPNTQILE